MKNLIFFLFIFVQLAQAQQYDNNFIFGNYFGGGVSNLSFDSGVLQVDTNFYCSNLPMHSSALTMSDADGNLLFYTNGIYVHNANCQKINSNDTNKLSPGFFADLTESIGLNKYHSLLSLPHTDSSNLYYLFHNSADAYNIPNLVGIGEYFYYTLIDMADPAGYIRAKNQRLLAPLDSFMSASYPVATKHANGKDWWLVIPAITYQKAFHSFLIKGDSIIRQPTQVMPDTFISRVGINQLYRETVFNNQGTQLINFGYQNQLQIYDFNRCTGQISLRADIFVDDTTQSGGMNGSLYYGGAAISPNDRFLYLATKWHILQYDLQAADIVASKEVVATFDGTYYYGKPTYFFRLALAPDGKIYGYSNSDYWDIIDNPNVKGIGCNVRTSAVYVGFLRGNVSLFTYPNYRLGADTSCWIPNSTAQTPQQEMLLYPNPAHTSIYLQSTNPFAANTPIVIYNSLGQVVKTQIIQVESGLLELDIANLPVGAYTLQIISGAQPITKQLTIIR